MGLSSVADRRNHLPRRGRGSWSREAPGNVAQNKAAAIIPKQPILAERRRRVAAGEEHFIPLEEAMRQLREEVACV